MEQKEFLEELAESAGAPAGWFPAFCGGIWLEENGAVRHNTREETFDGNMCLKRGHLLGNVYEYLVSCTHWVGKYPLHFVKFFILFHLKGELVTYIYIYIYSLNTEEDILANKGTSNERGITEFLNQKSHAELNAGKQNGTVVASVILLVIFFWQKLSLRRSSMLTITFWKK